jgi:hypothetical protein
LHGGNLRQVEGTSSGCEVNRLITMGFVASVCDPSISHEAAHVLVDGIEAWQPYVVD